MTDALLIHKGMELLVDHLGLVEAERFIFLVNQEPLDFTQYRQTLFEGMSVRELSRAAMNERKKERS